MAVAASGTPVPGNRWDLLLGADRGADSGPGATGEAELPEVSVVVPYYRDQAGLDLLLAALARQDVPEGRLQVVIADDGSPEPPRLPAEYPWDLRVVRQPDAGFRASAARALGASVAEGEVLAFLDGDMIPDRDYVRRAVRLPSRSPEAVVVGRRRHLDPALLEGGWRPGDPVPEAAVLQDPQWLERAYADSRNLLDADSTGYRFVISAVLTLSRRIYDEAGGFDPSFVGYGGEDWEFAHRFWRAGALLAHEPAAVAWHAGPDFAGRKDPLAAREVKNRESLMLAGRISAPTARGWALGSRSRPRVAVVLVMPDGGAARGVPDGGAARAVGDGGAAREAPDGGAARDVASAADAAGIVLCADALLQAFPAAALTLVRAGGGADIDAVIGAGAGTGCGAGSGGVDTATDAGGGAGCSAEGGAAVDGSTGGLPAGVEVLLADPRVSAADRVQDPEPGEEPDWLLTVVSPVRPTRSAGRPDPASASERLLEVERAGQDRIEITGPAGVVATLVSSRARWRHRRWGPQDPTPTTRIELAELGWELTGETPDLEAWWGGWG